MKKLLLILFLIFHSVSFGQEACSNGQTQIYIELSAIDGTGAGENILQISTVTGVEYFAVNFGGAQSYEYYTCLDDVGFSFTWIITSYDNNNPFNGSITINLDGPEGDLIQSTSANGQSYGTFGLEATVYGCMNSNAINFDETATIDDGESCIYSQDYVHGLWNQVDDGAIEFSDYQEQGFKDMG